MTRNSSSSPMCDQCGRYGCYGSCRPEPVQFLCEDDGAPDEVVDAIDAVLADVAQEVQP